MWSAFSHRIISPWTVCEHVSGPSLLLKRYSLSKVVTSYSNSRVKVLWAEHFSKLRWSSPNKKSYNWNGPRTILPQGCISETVCFGPAPPWKFGGTGLHDICSSHRQLIPPENEVAARMAEEMNCEWATLSCSVITAAYRHYISHAMRFRGRI